MCLSQHLDIIYKYDNHSEIENLDGIKREVYGIVEKKPILFTDICAKLPHLNPQSINPELLKMVRGGILHAGRGYCRYYGKIGVPLPKSIRKGTIKSGIALDILKEIKKRPLLFSEIVKIFPKVNVKSLKNAMYRLQGRVTGYLALIEKLKDGRFGVKNEDEKI